MGTDNYQILRIIDSISNLSNAQIGVEPTVDTDLNFRMWGGKDSAGSVTKFLAKDQPAFITSLRLTAAATTGSAGLLRHDTLGNIDGGLITLATLNSLITGSVLDDENDPRPPLVHASTHENGGSDEINVTNLSGLLVDGQTPLSHASTHENGGADEISVLGLSGLLADAQTPLSHVSTHLPDGSDEYLEPERTDAATAVTILASDKVVFISGTSTAPVTVTISNTLLAKNSFAVDIIDIGLATVNNITIVDGSGNEIAKIQGTGDSYQFISDGSAMRAR